MITPHADGTLWIACDDCGRETDLCVETATAARVEVWLLEHGWRSERQPSGDFADFCSECVAERQTTEGDD